MQSTSPFTLRRRWYSAADRQIRLQRPVISVGNVSFGGRGKTPLVAHVSRILIEHGERPAILARGYGRHFVEDGVVVVSDGTHTLADLERSGDEPFLLAREVPQARVLVCEQRAVAGALAETRLGATVHVLDDGFQHLQLARDLDVVLLGRQDFEERPMPFGRLREPIEAIGRAGAVVFDGSIDVDERSLPGSVGARRFVLNRYLGLPETIEPERPWTAPDRRVVAVAGIAEPGRFAQMLQQADWDVASRLDFADHHRYTAQDLRRIADTAARANAAVITTTKDAVRMLALRPLPVAIAQVPLFVDVAPAADFRALLLDRVRGPHVPCCAS
jgi:tetraacyldisaccharide 4'-kinase